MISADVYADPSALSRLYLHQEGSKEVTGWRAKLKGPLLVTHHGHTELVNGICRANFNTNITLNEMNEILAEIEGDFACGLLIHADLLWRATLNRAMKLSRQFTPSLGTRTLDVLHVASALELKMRHFFTYDSKQQLLARAADLKIVILNG